MLTVLSAVFALGSVSTPLNSPFGSAAPDQMHIGLAAMAARTGPRVAEPLPRSYVALGASETYGIGATPVTHGYAYQVAHALHALHFDDAGIPGATLPAAYDTELSSALLARPSLCTVFFGVNDLRAQIGRGAFLQDLYDLVVTLQRAHARVLIIGLPDLQLLPAVRRAFPQLQGIVTSWNQGMSSVARRTGAAFLDLRKFDAEITTHPGYISADGLHPSNAGHHRLAQVVVNTIRADHLWK